MSVVFGSKKRQNIVDLRLNYPEKFGRFIMALKNLINSADWARICGIHGNTFMPGDVGVYCPTDVATVTKIGGTGEPFYCKHGVYSFIAWHTPYVYQFELLLNKYNKSVNSSDYIELPWLDLTDFTADLSFLNDPEITIFYDKKRFTTENPLSGAYYYVHGVRMKTTRAGFFTPRTKKQRSQLTLVKKQLNNALWATSYEQFSAAPSSKVALNAVTPYVPLETPHNSLHDIIGGGSGNMSSIDIAAFDPVFWLHHCNMDRHYYSWVHRNTDGFKKAVYPDLMQEKTYNEPCAPFSKSYIYANDCKNYAWGFQNDSGSYMKVGDVLRLDRFPYTYDIITSSAPEAVRAFIELIDIPVPRESVEINAYFYRTGLSLDRELHWAGSAVWFGINRAVTSCCRCDENLVNIKIDIGEFAATAGLTAAASDYTLIIEATGRLIKDGLGAYKVYTMEELLGSGSCKVVVA